MKPFRIIVAGSRNFNNYQLLKSKLNSLLLNKKDIEIVSGTCRGADQLGERYGKENNHTVSRFPADWDKNGKKAGFIRNEQMANNADVLIAFWDGVSPGTSNMIKIAIKKELQVRIVKIGG